MFNYSKGYCNWNRWISPPNSAYDYMTSIFIIYFI